MRLKELDLNNFRCFESLSVSFSDLTLILADNGKGKSTILEAVRLAFGAFYTRLPDISGVKPAKERHLMISESGKMASYLRIKAVLEDGTEWDRTEKRDKSAKTQMQIPQGLGVKQINSLADSFIDRYNEGNSFEFPVVLYYGTERTVTEDMPQRRRNWQRKFTPFDALNEGLNGKANFRRFLEWFHEMEDRERREKEEQRDFDVVLPELQVVRQAIESMITGCANPRIKTGPLRFVVDQNGVEFSIDQLSDGYRITLAMIADIAGRLAEANPEHDNPLNVSGIVLIDEVDQHLHPKWQRRIVSDLHRTFPNIQFIMTTHSPIVALGSPEGCKIIHLGENNEKSETDKSTYETYNVNRLLVSSLFGLPSSQNPKWDEKIKQRDVLISSGGSSDELDKLNEELTFLNSESEDETEARKIVLRAAEILRKKNGLS